MAWNIRDDRDAIENALNRVARRAKYYADKGGDTATENDFTYAKTTFVNKSLKPVSIEYLQQKYSPRELKQELAYLEEISQRNYIGQIRKDFKDNVLKMAEKVGATKEEIAELKKTSPLKVTRQYKMGELNIYNQYKRAKSSAAVAKLERK